MLSVSCGLRSHKHNGYYILFSVATSRVCFSFFFYFIIFWVFWPADWEYVMHIVIYGTYVVRPLCVLLFLFFIFAIAQRTAYLFFVIAAVSLCLMFDAYMICCCCCCWIYNFLFFVHKISIRSIVYVLCVNGHATSTPIDSNTKQLRTSAMDSNVTKSWFFSIAVAYETILMANSFLEIENTEVSNVIALRKRKYCVCLMVVVVGVCVCRIKLLLICIWNCVGTTATDNTIYVLPWSKISMRINFKLITVIWLESVNERACRKMNNIMHIYEYTYGRTYIVERNTDH